MNSRESRLNEWKIAPKNLENNILETLKRQTNEEQYQYQLNEFEVGKLNKKTELEVGERIQHESEVYFVFNHLKIFF